MKTVSSMFENSTLPYVEKIPLTRKVKLPFDEPPRVIDNIWLRISWSLDPVGYAIEYPTAAALGS